MAFLFIRFRFLLLSNYKGLGRMYDLLSEKYLAIGFSFYVIQSDWYHFKLPIVQIKILISTWVVAFILSILYIYLFIHLLTCLLARVYVCPRVYTYAHAQCHNAQVEARGQPSGASSLRPPRRFWKLNSDHWFDGKCPYLWKHLTGPKWAVLKK